MPLNPAAVGATGDVRTISWTSKDALLYAVGIFMLLYLFGPEAIHQIKTVLGL